MNPKVVFVILLALLISSGVALASRLNTLSFDTFSLSQSLQQFEEYWHELNQEDQTPAPTEVALPELTPSPSISSSPTATPRPANRITSPTPPPQRQAECRRYKNKCYSQSDYAQLINLQAQLSASQTFYQFHLDSAARYQQEYEETGSSIYLDAKANSEERARQEKQKMDELSAQMYTIEQRGT